MPAWQMTTIPYGPIITLNLKVEKAKQYQQRTLPTYAMMKVSDRISNGE